MFGYKFVATNPIHYMLLYKAKFEVDIHLKKKIYIYKTHDIIAFQLRHIKHNI